MVQLVEIYSLQKKSILYHAPRLVLQPNFLACNTSNDDVSGVFGNDLIIVKHLEFCQIS